MISLLSHRMYSRYTRCTNKKKIRGVRLGVQEHSYLLNPNRTFFRLLAPTLSLATSTPSSRTTRTHTVPRFAHGKAALLPHPQHPSYHPFPHALAPFLPLVGSLVILVENHPATPLSRQPRQLSPETTIRLT